MIKGKYFEEGSAAQAEAALHLMEGAYHLDVVDGPSFIGATKGIKISDRLGNVERTLTLEDGAVFVTKDNDSVDHFFKHHNQVNSFIHFLESRMAFVVIALIATIAISVVFFRSGVPWMGEKIAHALPHKTNELIATETFKFLDSYIFEESTVDEGTQAQIRQRFFDVLVPLDARNGEINYKVHFRKWGDKDKEIPNALALPSGDIILTDKFVELTEHQNQIDAVLLHEMGHIVHRHSLEMVVQTTLLTVMLSMIAGDASGFVDVGLGVGSLLVTSSYVREHETEADVYAFEYMLKAGIDPQSFSDIMNKMDAYINKMKKSCEDDDCNYSAAENKNKEKSNEGSILDYLASHPSTAERVARAKKFSDCFKKNQIICDQ